jgi:CheY-like chemotaxis protein
LTLRREALFANLGFGKGKDIIMTATRPPGGTVFLVEDEVMIRMMVADMLEELGYSVAAEAGEINEAIRLAQSTEFDLAILDVNVNGRVISPVAELIRARKRPFIYATGYGSSGRIPRSPGAAKTLPDRNPGADDRHRAWKHDGLGHHPSDATAVIARHSRTKDGVASTRLCRAIQYSRAASDRVVKPRRTGYPLSRV